jgi:hypothetical protein
MSYYAPEALALVRARLLDLNLKPEHFSVSGICGDTDRLSNGRYVLNDENWETALTRHRRNNVAE